VINMRTEEIIMTRSLYEDLLKGYRDNLIRRQALTVTESSSLKYILKMAGINHLFETTSEVDTSKSGSEKILNRRLVESEIIDELRGVKKYHDLTSDQLMAQIAQDYNLQILGSGLFGTVIQTKNPDTVVKVFESDDAYLRFLEMANAHPNVHFPKAKGLPRLMTAFYKRHSIQPDKFVVLELEKLYPLDDDIADFCESLAYQTIDEEPLVLPDGSQNSKHMTYAQLIGDYPWISTLKRAMNMIIDWDLGENDMNAGNFMRRKYGTIVIMDPVYDPNSVAWSVAALPANQPRNVQGPHYRKKSI